MGDDVAVKERDAVQFVPDHEWGGCIGVVKEVRPWGAIVYLPIPNRGVAFMRAQTGDFVVVGKAEFILHDDDEDDTY